MLTELQCRLLHGTALVHNAGSVQAARLPRPMRHGRYARMNQAHDPTCVYIHVQTIRQVRKGFVAPHLLARLRAAARRWRRPGRARCAVGGRGVLGQRREAAQLPAEGLAHAPASRARPSSLADSHFNHTVQRAALKCASDGQGNALCRPTCVVFATEQPGDSCPVAVQTRDSTHLRVTPALSGGRSWPSARRSHSTAAPGSMSVCATWPCTCARAGGCSLPPGTPNRRDPMPACGHPAHLEARSSCPASTPRGRSLARKTRPRQQTKLTQPEHLVLHTGRTTSAAAHRRACCASRSVSP